ncbi:MAG: hypothetical protein KGJ80_20580 [Chloroflexota bacterium]|nr:hypothetical protein [Chloroflexota bacterium]
MSQNGFVKIAAILLVVSSAIDALIGIVTNLNPALANPQGSFFLWAGVVLVGLHVLEVIGVLGFWASGASGKGWLARIGLSAAVIGYVLIIVAEATLRVSLDQGNNLFGLATPFAGLGFILAGIAVIRAKQWTGWQMLIPLIIGLYPFVVLLPAFAITQGPNFLAIAGWSVCRLALGIALAQTSQNKITNPNRGTLQSIAVK